MPIWDQLNQNPMAGMILMSGLSNLSNSLSKQNLPARGAYSPGGGQQGGGMEEMLPQMLRMQAMQAQMQNQQQDNELARKQFEAGQAAAQQKQQYLAQAAKDMGVPVAVAMSNPDAVITAWADRMKAQKLSPGERLVQDGQAVTENPALLQATYGGVFNPRSGGFAGNPEMQQFDLKKAALGATRISNPVSITQDTLAAELSKTPAAMFRKISDAAYAAQSGMDATRAIYEMAKQNKDLFGPGMTLKADVVRRVEAARNIVAGGGEPSPEDARLLAVAKAVEVRQTNSAISKLRDIGGNDTEKEYERVKAAIPGLETSLPSHEVTFIQEKTAADYLTKMQEYVAQKTAAATQDRSLGMTTVDDAIREYKQANPLGDQLASNIQAVMQANGLTGQQQAAGGAPPPSAAGSGATPIPPATMPKSAPPGTPQHLWQYFQ